MSELLRVFRNNHTPTTQDTQRSKTLLPVYSHCHGSRQTLILTSITWIMLNNVALSSSHTSEDFRPLKSSQTAKERLYTYSLLLFPACTPNHHQQRDGKLRTEGETINKSLSELQMLSLPPLHRRLLLELNLSQIVLPWQEVHRCCHL